MIVSNKISLLLFPIFIILSCSLYSEIDRWHLQDINLKNCPIIKKIPLHTVYKYQDLYLKIWKENTRNMLDHRNDMFYYFAMNGALEEIIPLKAVIINEKGHCCGYATYPCQPITVNIQAIKDGHWTKYPHEIAFLRLLSRMQKSTWQFGVCFNDLSPDNFGIRNGICYLFDLDGIWNLQDYKKRFPNWQYGLFYLDPKFTDPQ